MTTSRPATRPIVLEGEALPHQLRDMRRQPDAAYLWGRLPPGPRVGIVGSRSPSREGFRIAFEVARELAALGMTIVSGGALGIDRAAHLGALRARGKTLVVAPLWYERAYPKQNRKLFHRIVAGGSAYARGATTIDAIAERTRLAAAVQHRVLRLTPEGVVFRAAVGLLRVVE